MLLGISKEKLDELENKACLQEKSVIKSINNIPMSGTASRYYTLILSEFDLN